MGRLSINTWPDHLLTLDEWDALPEEELQRFELVEGTLHVAAKPTPIHQRTMARLCRLLDDQLPEGLTAVPDVEVVVDAVFPPTVRAPDVVVVPAALVEPGRARFDPADVVLAVEILSPGTRRTDRVMKLSEYADAGIPHYWIVDLDGPVTLIGFQLVDGAYKEVLRTTGPVELTEPAPLSVDVTTLLARR